MKRWQYLLFSTALAVIVLAVGTSSYLAIVRQDRPGTLEQIGAWYAADPEWAAKVGACVRSIAQKLEVRR